MMRLSDIKKPGINVAHWRVLLDSRSGEPLYLASASPQGSCRSSAQAADDVDHFTSAINAGRILPDRSEQRLHALQRLEERSSTRAVSGAQESASRRARKQGAGSAAAISGRRPDAAIARRISSRRALHGSRAHADAGIAVPGRPPGFLPRPRAAVRQEISGSRSVAGASRAHRSGRRVRIQRARASRTWSRRSTTKPFRRFAMRSAARSIGPIRCTTKRWPYVETGDYRSAIRAYQEAIRLTPQYSYLPYNLGLVYQRLNRRKDAEAVVSESQLAGARFGRAVQRAGHAESVRRQARRSRAALPASPCRRIRTCCPRATIWRCCWRARSNRRAGSHRSVARESAAIARLSSVASQPGRNAGRARRQRGARSKNIARCWRPSPITWRRASRWPACWRRPAIPTGRSEELRQTSTARSQNPELFEQIGDLEAARQHAAEARAAYQSALDLAPDRAARKRIGNKLKSLR